MTKADYIKLVSDNPGCTATELAKLVNVKWGTASSTLYRLCESYDIVRVECVGMKGGENMAWRYFPKPILDL